MIAVIARDAVYPRREHQRALEFAGLHGIGVIEVNSDCMENAEFISNPSNRCYHCKKLLMGKLKEVAIEKGMEQIADGSNVDDLSDYRPGLEALKELGISSPLAEVGLSKQEIRELSKELGLETFAKPSMACLASRFPYGQRITEELLCMVEKGEEHLESLGFSQYRVRLLDKSARIEVLGQEIPRLLEAGMRESIIARFKELGFVFISLDLEGYRSGSMNGRVFVASPP